MPLPERARAAAAAPGRPAPAASVESGPDEKAPVNPEPLPASPDQSVESRKRAAIDELEEDIVLGYLYPRERLVEDDLLARFRLKRHVVRQVLHELERMGLVERKKNIGAIVKAYSLKEVVDLYALREILETTAARLIPIPVGSAMLDELESIQRQHDEAAANADPRAAIRTNIAFHRAVFALSENHALTEMIELAAQRAHAIRSLTITVPEYLENARIDHWKMIDALRVADRERLVELCTHHLHPARDAYITQLRQRAGRRNPVV